MEGLTVALICLAFTLGSPALVYLTRKLAEHDYRFDRIERQLGIEPFDRAKWRVNGKRGPQTTRGDS